jgi:tetratricopeptide (TPR) repeat protein
MPDTPTQLKVFVSHSHKDDATCHALVTALRDAGADVWYDEHNLDSGQLEVIERELRGRPVFLLILSPEALVSDWVKDECSWAYGLLRNDPTRIILPVLCDAVNEDDIWLFLRDFKRIEAPGVKPFPEGERIRQTLRALALTPKGQAPVVVPPQPAESVKDLLSQGQALQAQSKYAESLPFFERAALRAPNSFSAWYNLAFSLHGLDRLAEAVPAYERAIELKTKSASAWHNLIEALDLLQRWKEVVAVSEKALALGILDAYSEPYIWGLRAEALRSLGRTTEADEAERRSKEPG